MHIKSDNLLIRNANPSDAQILCNWWNDGKVMAHAGFPNGLGTNAQKIRNEISNDSDDTVRRLIIEYDDIPIGEMCYRNKQNKIAEIGIKICEFSKQNQGIGTKLLNMIITSLFRDYGYDKIILDTNLDNKRAQHVYEKIGFKKVSVNHNSWKNQLGELQSSVDYELNKSDYLML